MMMVMDLYHWIFMTRGHFYVLTLFQKTISLGSLCLLFDPAICISSNLHDRSTIKVDSLYSGNYYLQCL